MEYRNKTLNVNQVALLRDVLNIFKMRAEQTADTLPGRSSAYTIAGDLLASVLDYDLADAEDIINAYTEHISTYLYEDAVLQPSDPSDMIEPDPFELEDYRQFLCTIKTDGTDESKEENLRRWNQN